MDINASDPPKAGQALPSPNLQKIETWVFDLDNTLYPSEANLFAQIDQRMGEFIANRLDISVEEARICQKEYYYTYGTTLNGLMQKHAINPKQFLEYVHDIDVSVISPCKDLTTALERIKGRKIIYTNGSQRHAENILAALDIQNHFSDIIDIETSDYIPKPDPIAFKNFIDYTGIRPESSVMFEDLAINLRPAHALGMTTVWIIPSKNWGAQNEQDTTYVDFKTPELASFLTSAIY